MKKACLLLSLLLCLLFANKLRAQAVWSSEFPFAGELSSNEMTDVYQDAEGFIWVGTMHGLARYDGYRLQPFLANSRITALAEDSLHLWVGTGRGLRLIDKHTFQVTVPAEIALQDYISALAANGKGTMWVALAGGLRTLDADGQIIDTLTLPAADGKSADVYSLYYERENDVLWICTRGGLYTYSPAQRLLQHLPPVGKANIPFSILRDSKGRYWLATWHDGLWQVVVGKEPSGTCYIRQDVTPPRGQADDNKFYSLAEDDTFGYIWALSYGRLHAFRYDEAAGKLTAVTLPTHIDTGKMYTKLMKDRDGNLWVSSYDRGTLLTFHSEAIHGYPLDDLAATLERMPNLLTLNCDTRGRFWFVQDRLGLCLHLPQTGVTLVAPPRLQSVTVDARVTAPSPSTGGIWVASVHDNSVNLFDGDESGFDIVRTIRPTATAADQMTEAPDGQLWLRYEGRILRQNPDGTFCTTPDSLQFTSLAQTGNDTIWAATRQSLYLLYKEGQSLTAVPQMPLYRKDKDEVVCFICPDGEGGCWAATSMGRVLYKGVGATGIEDFTDRIGVRNAMILNMLHEGRHLWVVSHNRLTHYDTQSRSVRQFAPTDGNTTTSIFRDQAGCLSPDGTLFAGGRGGFTSITPPSEPLRGTVVHRPVLTDLRSGTRSLLFDPSADLAEGQPDIRQVVLLPETGNLSISFSTLDYAGGDKTRYACLMEGYDTEWNYLQDNRNTVYYRKLPKGNYTLKVKATDADGQWQQAETLIRITRLAAWYETGWAYAAYVLLALFALYAALHIYIKRLRSKNKLQLQETITRAKLDYFTNISHDLLTPLSVISCVGDYWERQYPGEEKQASILRHNIYRLRHLIGQALDFRKSEQGHMTLRPVEGDIVAFVRNLGENHFRPLAEQKGIELTLHLPEGECRGKLDFDKADKILYNLLSNAVKYTPSGKRVDFTTVIRPTDTGNEVEFTVEDEGEGIPEKEQEKVFERFYTGTGGGGAQSNGIGLSLVRDLTELHHGRLSLDSTPGKGTRFRVCLPIGAATHAEPMIQEETEPQPSEPQPETADDERPTILLVDDNAELLTMMSLTLASAYRIVTAANGREALSQLDRHDIDLMVSDVMMPDMDGLTLCRQVKSQMETSHIPVIMLTAMNSADDRVDCYKAGADGYVAKPFNVKVLEARIDNLIRTYRNRQHTFQTGDSIRLADLAYPPGDTQFLQDMADCVHDHLTEGDFGLDELAVHLRISKSTLHRKVKAMTGLTPLDFIRNIRLKYACMMLSESNLTVSETAYATGFSTPKYFTRCFKEEFGLTHSEYRRQHGGAAEAGADAGH